MHFHQYQLWETQLFLTPLSKEEGVIFSQLSQKWIRKYAFEWKKIVIIWNKSSYASGVYCASCGHIPYCRFCDIPIAYHTTEDGMFFGLCHLCKTVYEHPTSCEQCGSEDINDFGVWLQQIWERLWHQQIQSTLVTSWTWNSPSKVARVYEWLQWINTIIWTSLLANKPSNRKTDLLILQSVDTFFMRPDYRSTIDLVNLLDQILLSHQPKVMIIQTKNIWNAILTERATWKWQKIIEHEMEQLEHHWYPPYWELVIIAYKHEIESKVYDTVHWLYRELTFLNEKSGSHLSIKAIPSMVYKKFGKFHYQIVIKWTNVREFLDQYFEQLKILQRGFKVDRSPVGLS